MKLKLALFMFALGLGSSFAYAADTTTTAGSSCRTYCNSAYNRCMKNTWPDFCREQLDECLAGCGDPLP
jgi:hypothetical protein